MNGFNYCSELEMAHNWSNTLVQIIESIKKQMELSFVKAYVHVHQKFKLGSLLKAHHVDTPWNLNGG